MFRDCESSLVHGRTLSARRLLASVAAGLVCVSGVGSADAGHPLKMAWGPDRRARTADTGAAAVGGGRSASVTVSHTDSDFGPGTYMLQLGFAEDEIFAAQYAVQPDRFPITIRKIEFFLAQAATVPTETQYSLLIWDGPPDTGQPVVQFHSGELEDLPNVVMPAGPRGVTVFLEIDPSDPLQVQILNDSGTNSFSVGFRIDHHSDPPANPCDPVSLSTNAFPTTDVSGVESLEGNWLYALSCPGLCPSGWNPFSDLSLLCRPSGDWLIRATYEHEGTPERGACCDLNQECHDDYDQLLCDVIQGTLFEGMTCDQVTCPEPTGACCAFGTCLDHQTEAECLGYPEGIYVGHNTRCQDDPCVPGACCMPLGGCEELIELTCWEAGGEFQGIGTDCATADCPQPLGACCFGTTCVDDQLQEFCEATGVWMGPNTNCDCNPCVGIDHADPPSGTVDARQPHPVGSAEPLQGLGSADEPLIITLGVTGMEGCFELCETGIEPSNGIASVTDLGGGAYEIALDHAIAAGAVTTIEYVGDGSFVEYLSHPSNADGSAQATAADVVAIIDMLNGMASPVHGIYSQDIDHSGDLGPTDILRTMDLLNGAGEFAPWLDTDLPANTSCPP